jgi:hypothetical protein
MVYPVVDRVGPAAHEDMPPVVRALYDDAGKCAAVSRRAGAALARATVERLLKELDPGAPAPATLDKRIDRIRGQVSKPMGQMLDLVRNLGNKMLHVEDQPDELVVMALDDQAGPELVDLLLRAANELVDELITRPRMVKELHDRLR